MTNEIKGYLNHIKENEKLENYLSVECDFELADELQLKDDLEFLLEASRANYDIEAFACDGAGGIYALLDDKYVGYIDSEGQAGIVGNSVRSFFSILLNCGYISDYAKFEVLESKELFLQYYSELELSREDDFVIRFIENNDLENDPETIFMLFKESVMTSPKLEIKADNDDYEDSEQLFNL